MRVFGLANRGPLAALSVAGASLLSCGATHEESNSDTLAPGVYPPLACDEEPGKTLGVWRTLRQPDETLGPAILATHIGFVRGDNFSIFGRTFLAEQDTDASGWETQKTDASLQMRGATWASSERYLAVHGGPDQTRTYADRKTPLVQILDTETLEWTIYEPPDDFGFRSLLSLSWTGSEFLLWGGYSGSGETGTALAHTDGMLLDPTTGQWRTMAAADSPQEYPVEDGIEPINGLVSSTWTTRGLFALGSYPESDEMYAILYSSEEDRWEQIPMAEGPSLRKWTRLVASDDGVFVVGGVQRGKAASEVYYREVWHYSFETDSWDRLELPGNAGTFDGVWDGENLTLLGECRHHARYTPRTAEWSLLGPSDAPPGGTLYAAGGRIFLMDINVKQYTLPDVYIWEPDAD